MCGLYTVFGLLSGQEANNLEKIEHRGPDDIGAVISDQMFMGHVRLTIIDLTSFSNQPFELEGSLLVFNGEIYNYLELWAHYYPNHKMPTESDTYVLAKLLHDYGEKILQQLNGMFAFVFLNKTKNTVLVARDRFGIKPLYMYNQKNSISFASEIKCFDCPIDFARLENFLVNGSFQYGIIPYKGVMEVKGGDYILLNLDDLSFKSNTFYNPLESIHKKNASEGWLLDKLDNLLRTSIELHLRSDAPVGSLCSGGVDSSLLSAIAVDIDPNIKLYHAGVESGEGEEFFAEKVVKHIRHDIIYEKINKELFWQDFAYVTFISDIPIYHPNDLSLNLICKRVRADGTKVLISGEGADELFGGYTWTKKMINIKSPIIFGHSRFRYLNHLKKRIKRFIEPSVWANDHQEYLMFNPLQLGYDQNNLSLLVKSSAITSFGFRTIKNFSDIYNRYLDVGYSNKDAYALTILCKDCYGHLGSILHRTDRIMMANSIEGRVPFIENLLIELSFSLDLKDKLTNAHSKYLLKRVAERYLPLDVVYRSKVGFPVPWQKYLTGMEAIFQSGFIQELSGLNAKLINRYINNDPTLFFRFISLEVWGRIFFMKQTVSEVSETILAYS